MRLTEGMSLALAEAQKAADQGEVPIGAVIVRDGEVIGIGYNQTEQRKDATCHAEILAIRDASDRVGNWRLSGATVYVTLEPCPMCVGAIILAQIERVVFGSDSLDYGATHLFRQFPAGHRVKAVGGILDEPCRQILSDFFSNKRK